MCLLLPHATKHKRAPELVTHASAHDVYSPHLCPSPSLFIVFCFLFDFHPLPPGPRHGHKVSLDREVQLSWRALARAMKRKSMRVRDLYDKLDTDGSDSLDYGEFCQGLRGFPELHDEVGPHRSRRRCCCGRC